MDKTLQLLKELCCHCESNLNECNKGCAFRSLSNEYCEEYEKLKYGIKKLKKENMKAIMIVDLPDDYQEYGSGNWYVYGDDLKIVYEENGVLTTYKYIHDDMAQLKPMPTRKLAIFDPNHSDMEKEINGYNRCIDEILGGTE